MRIIAVLLALLPSSHAQCTTTAPTAGNNLKCYDGIGTALTAGTTYSYGSNYCASYTYTCSAQDPVCDDFAPGQAAGATLRVFSGIDMAEESTLRSSTGVSKIFVSARLAQAFTTTARQTHVTLPPLPHPLPTLQLCNTNNCNTLATSATCAASTSSSVFTPRSYADIAAEEKKRRDEENGLKLIVGLVVTFGIIFIVACYKFCCRQKQVEMRQERGAELTVRVTPSPAPAVGGGNPWEARIDPASGRTYYSNSMTGANSWTAPPGFPAAQQQPAKQQPAPSPAPAVGGGNPWEARIDPASGRTYYSNSATGTNSWTAPPGFPAAQQQPLKQQPAPQPAPRNPWVQQVDGSSGRPYWENTATGELSWNAPISPWVQLVDSNSGRPYWQNSTTGATSWTPPA
jgi:hypothetical protein